MKQPTPRTSLAAHVTITVYCRHCQHSAPLDLAGMAEAGPADTPLLELPLRCDHCGAIAYRINVSGPPFAGASLQESRDPSTSQQP